MVNNRVTIPGRGSGQGRRIIKKLDTQQQRIRFSRLYSHDGHIMQRFADGYIVVIGHHSQEKKLNLAGAGVGGDGFVPT